MAASSKASRFLHYGSGARGRTAAQGEIFGCTWKKEAPERSWRGDHTAGDVARSYERSTTGKGDYNGKGEKVSEKDERFEQGGEDSMPDKSKRVE